MTNITVDLLEHFYYCKWLAHWGKLHIAPLSITLMFYVAACDLLTKALFVSYWMHRGQEESKAGGQTKSTGVASEMLLGFIS